MPKIKSCKNCVKIDVCIINERIVQSVDYAMMYLGGLARSDEQKTEFEETVEKVREIVADVCKGYKGDNNAKHNS